MHLVSVALPGTCRLKGEKRGLWAACVLGVSFIRRWCLSIKLSEVFQLLVLANIPCGYELTWRVRTRGDFFFALSLSPLVADWTLNSTNKCGQGFVSLCVSLPLSLRVVVWIPVWGFLSCLWVNWRVQPDHRHEYVMDITLWWTADLSRVCFSTLTSCCFMVLHHVRNEWKPF